MASASVKRAVVRPYNPSTDFDDVVKICEVTAHSSIQSVAGILPYIYAIPYVKLDPETALVLDAGSSDDDAIRGHEPDKTNSSPDDKQRPGRVVGYVIGTANTQAFVERYRTEYLISMDLPTAVSQKDPSPTSSTPLAEDNDLRNTFIRILHEPEGMLHRDYPDFLEKYPAHLHIDIVPSHQGQGYGSILMTEFLKELRKKEVKGIHLGMRADNIKAGKFYERHGFEEYADINMDGTTWMVKGLK